MTLEGHSFGGIGGEL